VAQELFAQEPSGKLPPASELCPIFCLAPWAELAQQLPFTRNSTRQKLSFLQPKSSNWRFEQVLQLPGQVLQLPGHLAKFSAEENFARKIFCRGKFCASSV